MGRRQTPIARWSIHATGLAGSSRAPTSRISLSSRLMTIPFCIRRRCSRAPFLLRGVSPHGRRTAEQRDEQQPSGWSGERNRIFAADAGARPGRTIAGGAAAGIDWLSELSASAYHFDVLLGERHPLLAPKQLEQDLNPLARPHVGKDGQMIAEGAAQDSNAGAGLERHWRSQLNQPVDLTAANLV